MGALKHQWNSFEHQWKTWKPMEINKIQNTIETQNNSRNKNKETKGTVKYMKINSTGIA
jgi:hypothetical protein